MTMTLANSKRGSFDSTNMTAFQMPTYLKFNSLHNNANKYSPSVMRSSTLQRVALLACAVLFIFLIWPVPFETVKYNLPFSQQGPLQVLVDETQLFNNPLVGMDDPKVLAMVKVRLIDPPAEPYNFDNPQLADVGQNINPSAGQTQAVQDILEGFGKGPEHFFIDCGANDGEWYSNTIWPERQLGWSGLLLEPDPNVWPRLVKKNRKAYHGNFCLSDTTYPKIVNFYIDEALNGLGSGLIESQQYYATKAAKVSCFPLYSILLALGRDTVDYFSLDIEGNELEVLKNLPFDKITIKVLTLEHVVLKGGKYAARSFLESKGYIFFRTVVREDFAAGDSIYLHNSVKLTPDQISRIGSEDSNLTRPVRE